VIVGSSSLFLLPLSPTHAPLATRSRCSHSSSPILPHATRSSIHLPWLLCGVACCSLALECDTLVAVVTSAERRASIRLTFRCAASPRIGRSSSCSTSNRCAFESLTTMPPCEQEEYAKKRSFLITGANSGLGKATAITLAKLGGEIHMVCRNRERGEQAQNEIRTESGNDRYE